MPSFDARLQLPGQSRLPLNVVVDVSDERMVIISGKERLGEWALEEVEVDSRRDGFHLTVDQEEIILTVTDSARFAHELGVGGGVAETQVADAHWAEDNGKGRGRGISWRLETVDLDFEDVRARISILEAALTNESLSAAEFFARWLRLLKEINRRHGQGAIPSQIFYRLNTELLDLMPAPESTPPAQVLESRERIAETDTSSHS